MDPHGKFIPPHTEEQFLERARAVEPTAVAPILDTLKQRRSDLIRNIDMEIEFYEKVAEYREEGKL